MTSKVALSIETDSVALLAGKTQEVIAQVKNLGQTVEQFTLSIDGLDPSWYTLPLSSVHLFPNDQQDMQIILHPPKALEDKPGRYPFKIKIVSQDNPDEISVEDLTLEIKPLPTSKPVVSAEKTVVRASWFTRLRRRISSWIRSIRFPRIVFPLCVRQPVIESFEATTQDKREYRLSWSVRKARTVELNGEPVKATGNVVMCPSGTIEYTLTATNRRKFAREAIEISPPAIKQDMSSERISALLSNRDIKVYAGTQPSEATLQVQNLGSIVDQFTIGIEGIDQSWFSSSEPSVSLMPQNTADVQCSFQPLKKQGVRSGNYSFVISVRSQAKPEEVTTITGQLEVLPAPECTIEVLPMHVVGRKKGIFRLNVQNTGVTDVILAIGSGIKKGRRSKFKDETPQETARIGCAAQARIKATEQGEGCKFLFLPKNPEVSINAWDSAEIRMVAKPKRGSFVGEEKRYDITVAVVGESVNTPPVNCQLYHKPFIRSWKIIIRVVKIVVFFIILGILIWVLISLGSDEGRSGWQVLTSDPGQWWSNVWERVSGWF